MESIKLKPGVIPTHLKLGKVCLGAPVRESPEFPYGALQIGVAPRSFPAALLNVDVQGNQNPERVEIKRTDIIEPVRNIQVEITRNEPEGRVRRRILEEPISELALIRTEDGWVAQAEDLVVEDEAGLNIFATVVMSYAANKILDAEFSRPQQAVPEL